MIVWSVVDPPKIKLVSIPLIHYFAITPHLSNSFTTK